MDKEHEKRNDWEAIEYQRQFHIDHTTACIYIEHGLSKN